MPRFITKEAEDRYHEECAAEEYGWPWWTRQPPLTRLRACEDLRACGVNRH